MEEITIDPDKIMEEISKIREKLAPYQRTLMYILITAFLIILFFLGFALGGVKVCTDVRGFLDDTFKCHVGRLDYEPNNHIKDPLMAMPYNLTFK